MNITRRSVLLDALKARELIVQRNSVDGMMLTAREGSEESFDRYSEECRILRELIQALEDSCVRAAIAEFLEDLEFKEKMMNPGSEQQPCPPMPQGTREWQKDVMIGEKQVGLFMTDPEGKVFADYRVVEFNKAEDRDRTVAQKLAEMIGEIDLDYVEPDWNTMEVIYKEHDAVAKQTIAIKFTGREKDEHQKEDGADHPEGK